MIRQPTRSLLSVALVLAVAWTAAPAMGEEQPLPEAATLGIEGQAVIQGKILRPGVKGGIPGAVVHAYHVGSGETRRSEPSGKDGTFRLAGLRHGYQDLAVEVDGELFVANQVINLPPSGKVVMQFSVERFEERPASLAGGDQPVTFPGADRPAAGVAGISKKLRGADFWKSPKGVAIISSIVGAGLIAIAAGGDPEPFVIASPSSP